jgi:hypothetical protein
VITAIRSLRETIDALIGIVNRADEQIEPAVIAVPVEEAFLSWANLRSVLQRGGIDPALVERLDNLFTRLARLTSDSANARTYRTELAAIREVVTGGLNDLEVRFRISGSTPL